MGLSFGLIGCGGISAAHRQAMRRIDGADFVAFCDLEVERADAARQEENAGRAYADFDEMLDAGGLDGIVIATPPSVRTGPIASAARRGLPVLCEKPPAADLETARRTESAIREHSGVVSVAFLFRYYSVVDKLRELIAGRPVAAVRSRYLGDVANNKGLVGERGWFLIKEKSGGMIIDQGIHNLDLIRFLFGDVSEVVAQGAWRTRARSPENTAEDTATIQFRTATGVLVSHVHCWGHNRWCNEIEVIGADFGLTLDLNDQRLIGAVAGDQIDFEAKGDGFEAEQRAWIAAVKTGDRDTIRSPHADASASLALALAANRAMETGNREPVEPL